MKIDIAEFAVRSNGSINEAATVAAFTSALRRFIAENEAIEGQIGEAVHALFDKHEKGKLLAMPFILGEVRPVLGVTPDTFKLLTDRITAWVKGNPEFVSKVGRGGGVGRVCDQPAEG